MDCPGCGASVPEARFCIACGVLLSNRCPGCGGVCPPAARFCPECGAGLHLEASAPAPPPTGREAERRQLTVMFIDLVGSTELAARLDPEDTSKVIRDYQDACAEVVRRWDGHVAKFMGDGILAYFGWPQAHEDDAERAVRAGLALIEGIARQATPAGDPLSARIGIATGLVVVGELIGEGSAREETVVGETPSLAARLQALAEPGGLIISDAARRLIGHLFDLVDLGPQSLNGLAQPHRAWRAVGLGRMAPRPQR